MTVGAPPPKFTKNNLGVRVMNPEYKRWQAAQRATGAAPAAAAPEMLNSATALPIVSSIEEQKRHLQGSQTSDAVTSSIEMLQDEDIAAEIGMTGQETMDHLTRIFSKYETPMGLLNKLLGLSDFVHMEMIIDDSGSMNMDTDSKDPSGRWMTRWEEVHQRLVSMFEIIAYIPSPPCSIRFLNRSTVIEIAHAPGERPEVFLQRTLNHIAQVFRQMPRGTTPARERIYESLQRYPGQSCIRWFFGDGQPNGGNLAQRDITQMLIHRPSPQSNPFTFCSCTNEDDQVEWMKEAEEAAPYCAELDDFFDESREVLHDQGQAFPFSYGMYLISQLVAAFNPNDLDAMDESAPFTKNVLDQIQGYRLSPQEYQYYFDSFLAAQASHEVETALDKLKKDYLPHWRANFQHFLAAPFPKDIPVVQAYHQAVTELKRRGG